MKRRLFKLGLFLVLGAVVNVAVAWGCAALLDMNEGIVGYSPLENNLQWSISRYKGSGAGWVLSSTHEYYTYDFSPPTAKDLAPSWANLHQAPPAGSIRGVHAYGWPSKSLWCEFIYDINPGPGWITRPEFGGIHLSSPDPRIAIRSLTKGRGLPLFPIWPGFAINTIIYSTILWLLTLAPFTARRMIRRKRGRCIKCGYDLRNVEHEVCPECGSELSAKAKP